MIAPDRLLPQQEIYNFLRSVTIKYEPIAHFINESLMKKGIAVNPYDPTTWKYYLNMVGEYHPSDTPMYVTSLDTRQPILFTKEVLASNMRTRAIYKPGGIYYNRLCESYPDQVDLIKSILFPVENIEKAILAPDLTLLGYGSGYLEEFEESKLVTEVEVFLEVLKERWYFDFLDDEPYFYVTFWGSLWTYLAMLLMSARMGHIKTPYVHSSDIWNELGAHGLDNYSDILDREKSMMLYQNIDYFKANAGKQSNLMILASRLLGSFGIGLYGRIVVQEAASAANDYQLTPQLVPKRLTEVSGELAAAIEIKTVATVQSEIFEKGLTPSNAAEVVESIERKLGDTTLNEFATKFLEIRPIAKNKPYAEVLNMFLLETLVVSIKAGYYSKPVEVLDPLTSDAIFLPPAQLLALYHYASRRAIGLETENFPNTIRLYRAFNTEIPEPKEIIQHMGKDLYISMVVNAKQYLSGLEYDKDIANPEDFSTNVTNLFLRYMDHLLLDQKTSLNKTHDAYAYLSELCHTRREESITLLEEYDTYNEWLGGGGIDIYSSIFEQYSIQGDPNRQWANLADAIISTLIPINDTLRLFGNFTLSDSGYDRLRKLFIQLCSYRVVFLESDRNTAEFVVGPKWSTNYGPDDTVTYGERITQIIVDYTDTTVIKKDQVLHTGVDTTRLTSMRHEVTYTVTTSTDVLSTTMLQTADNPPKLANTTSATTVSQGAINMVRHAPIPVMVKK